ncbi:carboxymuconolactone decarboxylase family protein [Novosphingobium sp. Gsoil 351]|uniref:carboxymuconolactone decarboxylase family protein n=1 Tax=Novosphingobium sp. Gsoil 351 TaxID=2675225 RepID=UPI0012B49DA2|nr:carboxymuconolactone decarboxylase family protein [Novosphingobium sp. Gsoil 351]QGN55493.1 carboxymuconolactone decarboxylase family protein [Novosphingobium sp. Gsoil 351]
MATGANRAQDKLTPRLAQPRVPPLEPHQWDPAVGELLTRGRPPEFGDGDQPVFNVFKTLAHYPAAMRRLAPWGNHVLFKSSLPPREREMVILRAGWLARAEYEFAHHVEIALEQAGLSDADIAAIKTGPETPGLSPEDSDLLRAVDDLVANAFISDPLWGRLAERFTIQQLMDLIFAVGHYTMMSMVLNTLGVQLERMESGSRTNAR